MGSDTAEHVINLDDLKDKMRLHLNDQSQDNCSIERWRPRLTSVMNCGITVTAVHIESFSTLSTTATNSFVFIEISVVFLTKCAVIFNILLAENSSTYYSIAHVIFVQNCMLQTPELLVL